MISSFIHVIIRTEVALSVAVPDLRKCEKHLPVGWTSNFNVIFSIYLRYLMPLLESNNEKCQENLRQEHSPKYFAEKRNKVVMSCASSESVREHGIKILVCCINLCLEFFWILACSTLHHVKQLKHVNLQPTKTINTFHLKHARDQLIGSTSRSEGIMFSNN